MTSLPTLPTSSITTDPAVKKTSSPTSPSTLSADATPWSEPPTDPVLVMVTLPEENVVRFPETVPEIVTEPEKTVKSPSIVPSTMDDTAVTYWSSLTV
jgi:hypothetical protein